MSSSIKQLMSEDHKHCDNLFLSVSDAVNNKNWADATSLFSIASNDIYFHFDYEETTLFPLYESSTNITDGPTLIMRMEHNEIRDLMHQIQGAINQKNAEDFYGLYEGFNIYIQQHNMKEEGVLYPMIDETCDISDKHIESMLSKINNRAA